MLNNSASFVVPGVVLCGTKLSSCLESRLNRRNRNRDRSRIHGRSLHIRRIHGRSLRSHRVRNRSPSHGHTSVAVLGGGEAAQGCQDHEGHKEGLAGHHVD
ncbi:unnamed protein product, partial [Ixodes pacificus]